MKRALSLTLFALVLTAAPAFTGCFALGDYERNAVNACSSNNDCEGGGVCANVDGAQTCVGTKADLPGLILEVRPTVEANSGANTPYLVPFGGDGFVSESSAGLVVEHNIDLTHVTPELNLYDRDWPIWTHLEQHPPAKFVFDDADRRGYAIDSLISGGCIVSGSSVRRSILFTNVRVYNHSRIEDSVILPSVEIGPSAIVRNAIIDKRCVVPEGMEIGIDPEADRRRFHVTEKGRVLVVPEMLERLA